MESKEELRIAEYNNLRNEQNARLNFMYTHGISSFTVVVALLSVNIGLFVSAYELVDNLINTSSMYYIGIVLMQELLFFVPVCMVLPASDKAGENLRKVAMIGAYFKIFYEIPHYQKGESDNPMWEILQCSIDDAHANPKNLRTFNFEYCILVILSAALLCLFCVYYIWRFVVAKHIAAIIVFAIVSAVILALTVLITIKVFNNVSVKKEVTEKTESATEKMLAKLDDEELKIKARELLKDKEDN